MKDNLYLGIIIPLKKGSKYIFHLFNVHIIISQCFTLNKEFSFIKKVKSKKWKNPCYFLFNYSQVKPIRTYCNAIGQAPSYLF